ncbi:MAG: NAD(+) diphosphatase [Suipraeoptans sp.]
MIHEIKPHKYHVDYKPNKPVEGDIFLIYGDNKLLMRVDEEDNISYPALNEIQQKYPDACSKAKFMFRIDNQDYYEIRSFEVEPFDNYTYHGLEELRITKPAYKAFAGITGAQIHNWYTDTTFCGRCGKKLIPKDDERAMMCPDKECGKVYYPTISPSVIVAITNEDKILLTKYAGGHSNRYRRYALVAGYAEVGETLEDTVKREVMEEVGLKVKNIRYYKSQPWSFSGTLLAGFFCEVDGNTNVTLDETELSEATWFKRDEMPETVSAISLTNEMIEYFRNNK